MLDFAYDLIAHETAKCERTTVVEHECFTEVYFDVDVRRSRFLDALDRANRPSN